MAERKWVFGVSNLGLSSIGGYLGVFGSYFSSRGGPNVVYVTALVTRSLGD